MSDAQLMICPQFLPKFPWSFFPDKILQGVREEKLQLKDFRVFFTQTIAWPRDVLIFFIAYFILSKRNSSIKIISISADDDFSPLRSYIFKRRNLFIKYVKKCENRLYIYKYNWKDLNELFPGDLWLFCNISRPLCDDDFTIDLTQGKKFFSIFHNIFRGNSNKNLHFPLINIIFIH